MDEHESENRLGMMMGKRPEKISNINQFLNDDFMNLVFGEEDDDNDHEDGDGNNNGDRNYEEEERDEDCKAYELPI